MELLILHAGIIVTLFVPGMLVVSILKSCLREILEIDLFAGVVAMGFAFSIFINLLIVGIWSSFTSGQDQLIALLLFVNVVLLSGAWVSRRSGTDLDYNKNHLLLGIACIAFVVMLRNGGLVDVLADSWWHMSYANKMVQHNTFLLDKHHLTGIERDPWSFVYEPGWHSNIAILMVLTGSPAPLIWHTLGAYCAVVTLLSYYMFTMSLTNDRVVSTVAVTLFFVLFGAINSYSRVSPWPGNVSYILLYLCFAMVFILGKAWPVPCRGTPSWRVFLFPASLKEALMEQKRWLAMLLLLLLTVSLIHFAEVVLLVFGLVFYSYGLFLVHGIYRIGRRGMLGQGQACLADTCMLGWLWIWFFAAWSVIAIIKGGASPGLVMMTSGGVLAGAFITLLPGYLPEKYGRSVRVLSLVAFASICLAAVDLNHLRGLFFPSLNTRDLVYPYIPFYVDGHGDEGLRLPQWRHQLRSGLLFSAVVAVFSSLFLVYVERSRSTIFLCSNAMFAFLVLLSPHLFTYFSSLLPVTGVYRLHILIFHPVILSCLVVYLARVSALQRP